MHLFVVVVVVMLFWFSIELVTVVTLLDYGAGNVRSVRNAIRFLGFDIKDVSSLFETCPILVLILIGHRLTCRN